MRCAIHGLNYIHNKLRVKYFLCMEPNIFHRPENPKKRDAPATFLVAGESSAKSDYPKIPQATCNKLIVINTRFRISAACA